MNFESYYRIQETERKKSMVIASRMQREGHGAVEIFLQDVPVLVSAVIFAV